MACYDNIIGLARQDCPCFEVDPPEGYNTSNSGIYLADLKPLDTLTGYGECGEDSIWAIMQNAVDEAVKMFKADTNAVLLQHFKERRTKFKGTIGERTSRETFTTSKTYAGLRLDCNPMRGGTMKITAIGTCFSAAGTVQFTLYNSVNEQVWQDDLTVANGFHLNTLATPIEVPLYIPFDDKHEYFLTYEHNPANPARKNGINTCGCGGFHPYFNCGSPMWGNTFTGERAWANWLMAGGWEGDTLTDFDEADNVLNTYLNGITLQVELGCDTAALLCNGEMNFNTDALALTKAYAIRYKAASLLAAKILGSDKLIRANVVNRETWMKSAAEWEAQYEKAVLYIGENAETDGNDCLICKDPHGLEVKTNITTWSKPMHKSGASAYTGEASYN